MASEPPPREELDRFAEYLIEEHIKEKRKKVDDKFNIWSTRLRALAAAEDHESISDTIYKSAGFLDDCSCCLQS